MDKLAEELHNNLRSGAAVNISGYLRQFEEAALTANVSLNSLILQLFACYITDKLIHAKLAWKRVPISLKTTPELEKTWKVGKDLLKKEYSSALALLNSYHWIVAADVVGLLKKKLIEDTKKRVAKTYVSIETSKFAEFLSVNLDQALEIAGNWGWRVENNYIFPIQVQKDYVKEVEERDISLITELVSYLEQKNHIGIGN